MRACSFCGCPDIALRAGRLALCGACRAALCAVAPDDARYPWFCRAVGRALSGGVAAEGKGAEIQPVVDKM